MEDEISTIIDEVREQLAEAIRLSLVVAARTGATAALEAFRDGCRELADEGEAISWPSMLRRIEAAIEVMQEVPVPA